MDKLSERMMVRLDPELAAAVDVLRSQKARAAGIQVKDIPISGVVRDLLRRGATSLHLLESSDKPAGKKSVDR